MVYTCVWLYCSDTEDERAHKTWKKSIMLVWRSAANHKYVSLLTTYFTFNFVKYVTNWWRKYHAEVPGFLGFSPTKNLVDRPIRDANL